MSQRAGVGVASQCRFGPLPGEDGRRDPAGAFAVDDRVDLSDPVVGHRKAHHGERLPARGVEGDGHLSPPAGIEIGSGQGTTE